MREPVVLRDRPAHVCNDDAVAIHRWDEVEVPALGSADHSLRLLARWLISAARKGVPVADSSQLAEDHIVLDVHGEPEVVSKPK